MVAISLHRGNLHKVPDVPRRWLIPTPKISLKDFKTLLHRRSKALSRLDSSAIATTSNPNPDLSFTNLKQDENPNQNEDVNCDALIPEFEPPSKTEEIGEKEIEVDRVLDGGDCEVKLEGGAEPLVEGKSDGIETLNICVEANGNLEIENIEAPANPSSMNKEEDALNDRDRRKKEIEEKLQILNLKKHNLVQMLKQILNAEEELKRRGSMQGIAGRPPVPLNVDATNMEGGEADDISNHNVQSRNFLRMNSISPSSDSPYRRPGYNGVPHPSRATPPVASSPSRFAPTGQQGHPTYLPTVSVSGTNYIASSPSPATSGGTSAFRDGRLPSPWN